VVEGGAFVDFDVDIVVVFLIWSGAMGCGELSTDFGAELYKRRDGERESLD